MRHGNLLNNNFFNYLYIHENSPKRFAKLENFGKFFCLTSFKSSRSYSTESCQVFKKINGTKYDIGSFTNLLYAASGGSNDWAMEKAAVPIIFTIDLPGYKNSSFILPKKMIQPFVRGTYEGFVTIVNTIIANCCFF